MGSPDLWERSLERSLRRRELAAAARREIGRRRRASVAATAAVAVAPVATSVSFSSSSAAASKAASQPSPHRDSDPVILDFGDTGPSVRQVQRALGLVVDGIYGPKTERAVFRFQRTSGLPATGKVDVRTWVALLRHMESWRATPPTGAPAVPERDAAPELQSAPAPAPAAAVAKPAPERKPARTRRSKAAKPAASKPRRAVKHDAPSKPPARETRVERPAAKKAPATSGRVGRILDAIATCESGGNPTAVGGGGQYRGLYQFDQQTWESLGGSGDPAAASPADQTKRAAMLYERSGVSAWPTCGPAAMQTASASRGETGDAGPSAEQPAAATEAQPEVTAAAVEREPATSAAPAPQAAPEPEPQEPQPEPEEPTVGAASASRDVPAQSQPAAAASSAPSASAGYGPPSAEDRVTPEPSEVQPGSQPEPTAPPEVQSNESVAEPEGPPQIEAPQIEAPQVDAPEPVQEAPEPVQQVEAPDAGQVTEPLAPVDGVAPEGAQALGEPTDGGST